MRSWSWQFASPPAMFTGSRAKLFGSIFPQRFSIPTVETGRIGMLFSALDRRASMLFLAFEIGDSQ